MKYSAIAQPEYGAMYCIGAGSDARGDDDDRVLHRAGLLQPLDDGGDGGRLLADGDVDADDALPLLVDDRVDRDRGLAGAAVADDQLALAAADRDHRVDRLDAGLQRLLHRLAHDDAGRLATRPCASCVVLIVARRRRSAGRARRRRGRRARARPAPRARATVRRTSSPSFSWR